MERAEEEKSPAESFLTQGVDLLALRQVATSQQSVTNQVTAVS